MMDFLRKIGLLRSGSAAGTYTSAKDQPDALAFEGVYNAKKDQVAKQDLAPSGSPHLMGMMILLMSGLLGIFFVVGIFSVGGFSIWSILMVVLWLVFLWIGWRAVASAALSVWALIGYLIAVSIIAVVLLVVGTPKTAKVLTGYSTANTNNSTSIPAADTPTQTTPSGSTTIVTQGELGVLAGGGSLTLIGATSNTPGTHGGYLYMGDGGATATFQIAAPSAGSYALWVRVDDDGKHANDTRSVSIAVGGTSNNWNHVSRNTNGWVYEKVGTYALAAGSQTVVITKLKTTSAAFSMDEFILSADPAYQPK